MQQVGTLVKYILERYLTMRYIYPFSCCYVTDMDRLQTLIQTAHTLTLWTLIQIVSTHTDCGHPHRMWILTQTVSTHSDCEHSLRLWMFTQTVTLTQTVNTHSDCIHLIRLPHHKSNTITVILDSRKWSHWHSYQIIQLMMIKFFRDLILYHLLRSSQCSEVLQYLQCQGQVVTSWIAWPLRLRYHVILNISNYVSTLQCGETSDE